jgi:hypothetical protein
MTAGLTVLEYSDTNEFEVEYYTVPEWDEFKKQAEIYSTIEKEVRSASDFQGAPESIIIREVKNRTSEVMQSAYELVTCCGRMAQSKIGKPADSVPFNKLSELQRTLNDYVGANGEYTSVVKALTLRINDPRLKGVRIVDTPGVNDPIVSRENRTKEFLHSCHGVFFLSYSSRFFDSVDINFMNSRIGDQGVGTVLLLASKYDEVLQDQGQKYHDDIETADDESRKSLERRFNSQKNELSHKDVDIRFDTTSGISFSLATKNSSQWDEMESHVDSRMHSLYPSAFRSRQESVDTYQTLANLTTIKEEYLEKMFLDNKERIIQSKISEYFSQNAEGISKLVNQLIDDSHAKIKQLESTDLKKIHAQQEEQDKLFTSLKGEFSTFLKVFQNSLQTAFDQYKEEIRQPHINSFPMENVDVNVTYKGDWWGHNTDYFTAKTIDTQKLKEQLERMVDEYCKEWYESWKSHFSKAKEKMFESFCEAITNFSCNTSLENFSDRYYRQLMTQVLSDIERFGILHLQDKRDKSISELSDACSSQHLHISQKSYEVKGRYVQCRLDADALALIEPLKRVLNNKLDGLVRDVTNSVSVNIKPVTQKLEDLRSSIDQKLKTAGKEYLDNLKTQIQQKEETKNEINRLLDLLTPLQKSLQNECNN